MAENSKIEWTHHTFNPWIGCVKVSDGCKNCYAEADFDKRRRRVSWGPMPKGTRILTSPDYWKQPAKWNRDAEAEVVRRRVFCASMADVFEDWQGPIFNGFMTKDFGERNPVYVHKEDPTVWHIPGFKTDLTEYRLMTMGDIRLSLFEIIEATPNLDWLLLTKRPENINQMIPERWENGLPSNLWLGTSVENQETADERIPHLLNCPASVRFLSCEPLIGSVDLTSVLTGWDPDLPGCPEFEWDKGIHWVICGGESGPNARPMHPDWARSLRDQCQSSGVPFFFKQWGEWLPGNHYNDECLRLDRDSVQSRYECAEWHEGEWNIGYKLSQDVDDENALYRVGKKAAGRLLDNREWNEFPGVKE